jgi:hypothetical protein
LNRFLLISPYFTPSSRIGAKRALNLVRHLPALGWEPVVLCCPEREGSELLGQDGLTPPGHPVHHEFGSWLGRTLRGRGDSIELLPQVHSPRAESRARRIPLLGPGLEAIRKSEITPLDQYMWDIPFLVGRATRIARDERARAIVVNADPWSGLVVGAAVARRLDLPLIADLRDPWALHPRRQPRRTAITRAAIFELERRLLRRANRIVLNTERSAAAYRDHYAGVIAEDRFTFIRNAFDASIYHAPVPTAREGFAIHYFGTVGSGRDPADFYAGLARFLRELGPAAANVKIVFHGDSGPTTDPRVQELGLEPHIEVGPHVPLRETLRALHEADVLLLVEGEDRSLQLPAKLYDYLAAERPILAVGAHAELADILERTRAGVSTGCGEGPDAVTQRLRDLYRDRRRPFVTDEKAVDEFRADAQAMRFRQLLEEVVQEGAGSVVSTLPSEFR